MTAASSAAKAVICCPRCASPRHADATACTRCRRPFVAAPLRAPAPVAAPPAGRSPYLPADPLAPLTLVYLFVSRRLDIRPTDRTPAYAAPVILFGPTPHYRLTPAVFAWVEQALTSALDRPGRPPDAPTASDERRAALEAYDRLASYANAAFVPLALTLARATTPQTLPPTPWVPDG